MKKLLRFPLLVMVFTSVAFAQDPTLEIDEVLISNSEMGQPWGMSFISDDELFFTEKSGKLFNYVISTNTKTEITGIPSVAVTSQGGLLDVAIHPDFATNKYIYLAYSISGNGGYTLAIGRGVLEGNSLTNFEEIFRALPFRNTQIHFGSRIVFDDENHIYFSSSDRGQEENAQLLSNHSGKIMRLNDDGSIPEDNPFVDVADAQPEIYTYGNRNPQGLVYHAPSGKIYAHEHGPQGGDELNLIEAGNNYGWPEITFGIDYDNTIISEDTAREGMEQPIRYWVPSIAPCGMAIVPLENQGPNELNFLVGALAAREVQWVKIDNDQHVETFIFLDNVARFRDVEVAPDGQLYALTEYPNQLLRLRTNQQIVTSTSQNDLELDGYLYPNPSEEFIKIDVSPELKDELTSVNVYSNDGKLVKVLSETEIATISDTIKIDIKDFASGTYIVKVISNGQPATWKFEKK